MCFKYGYWFGMATLDDEFPKGTFGPDGLWQAVAVYVGDDDSNGQKYGVPVAMWPAAYAISQIPTVEGSGNYSVNDSSSVYDKETMQSSYMHGFRYAGNEYFESVFFPEKGDGTPAKTNGSIIAADEYYQELGTYRKFNQSVGILGLGSDEYFQAPGSGSTLLCWSSSRKMGRLALCLIACTSAASSLTSQALLSWEDTIRTGL